VHRLALDAVAGAAETGSGRAHRALAEETRAALAELRRDQGPDGGA
jgi:hypothetical protein